MLECKRKRQQAIPPSLKYREYKKGVKLDKKGDNWGVIRAPPFTQGGYAERTQYENKIIGKYIYFLIHFRANERNLFCLFITWKKEET